MAEPTNCTVILLAAGRSVRFGAEDKLLADYCGRPLVDHAGTTIAGIGFAHRIAVVRAGATALRQVLESRGYAIVENDEPEAGLSRSLRLGIGASRSSAILIALADMPLVPEEHFVALCRALSPATPIVASLGPEGPMVPAAFIATEFDKLLHLTGDTGARALLAGAATVAIDPDLLVDIDLPDHIRPQAAIGPDICRE